MSDNGYNGKGKAQCCEERGMSADVTPRRKRGNTACGERWAGQGMEGKGTEVAKTEVPEAGAHVAGAQTGEDEEKRGLTRSRCMRFLWDLIESE